MNILPKTFNIFFARRRRWTRLDKTSQGDQLANRHAVQWLAQTGHVLTGKQPYGSFGFRSGRLHIEW
jgi:hypothetical protein